MPHQRGYRGVCKIRAQIAADADFRRMADFWPRPGATFRQAILALVQASGESPLGQRVGSPQTQDLEAVLGPAAEGQGGAQASERRAAPFGGGPVVPEPARSAGGTTDIEGGTETG